MVFDTDSSTPATGGTSVKVPNTAANSKVLFMILGSALAVMGSAVVGKNLFNK